MVSPAWTSPGRDLAGQVKLVRGLERQRLAADLPAVRRPGPSPPCWCCAADGQRPGRLAPGPCLPCGPGSTTRSPRRALNSPSLSAPALVRRTVKCTQQGWPPWPGTIRPDQRHRGGARPAARRRAGHLSVRRGSRIPHRNGRGGRRGRLVAPTSSVACLPSRVRPGISAPRWTSGSAWPRRRAAGRTRIDHHPPPA